MATTLSRIWFYPPLAFARVGSAQEPLDCFAWGPNDNAPRGTGKTTILPQETLDLDANGGITGRMPEEVAFKQVVDDTRGMFRPPEVVGGGEVFRPVCPWFELHGRWVADGREVEGPVTRDILAACGASLGQVRWAISVANHKAYSMTLSTGDRISASLEMAGDDTTPKALNGISARGQKGERALVPEGRSISFGRVQLAKPSPTFPELRLRFTPPAGLVYGPMGLREKIGRLRAAFPLTVARNQDDWERLNIPQERLILDDEAEWSRWVLSDGDARTVPVLQFANIEGPDNVYNSLGLIDDFCDGVITCIIPSGSGALSARTRIVVTPPDFAPDRRHVVSLADNLKDRTERDVRAVYATFGSETLTHDVQDLFQRVWETMALVNVDAMNTKDGFQGPDAQPPYAEPVSSRPLPLTVHARRAHRRLVAVEVLEDLFRERDERARVGADAGYAPPRSLADLINAPPEADGTMAKGNSYRKMPAVMRGSDGTPMHVTRRQYQMLQLWIAHLRGAATP